jgi:Protein of unknown function (DUF4240)
MLVRTLVAVTLVVTTTAATFLFKSDRPTAQNNTTLCTMEMPEERFWTLIDGAAHGNNEARVANLRDGLSKLTADELIGFSLAFGSKLNDAYTWDLWAAAYVANGGASDDGFAYFRYWLISRGREAFERVVKEPDNLADIVPGDETEVLELEEFSSVAPGLWLAKTGNGYDALSTELARFAECKPVGAGPSGSPFREDPQAMAKRYPKLWRRFGENPLG